MKDSWFVACGFAVILALYGLAGAMDAVDEAADADLAAAYEQGVKAGRAAALETVSAAWQAGLREAQERCAAPAATKLAERR